MHGFANLDEQFESSDEHGGSVRRAVPDVAVAGVVRIYRNGNGVAIGM